MEVLTARKKSKSKDELIGMQQFFKLSVNYRKEWKVRRIASEVLPDRIKDVD